MTLNDLPPQFVVRPDGVRLAYRYIPGNGPAILFLPGYMSDMQGSKAQALASWASNAGRAMLRLDYSGCGESDGAFEDGTLEVWRDDVLTVIEEIVTGPVILVGSSMGGWLMLLVAQMLGDRVEAIVGVAAAPDFTDWDFSDSQRTEICRSGRVERPSDYGDEPMVITKHFWLSGQEHRQLTSKIGIHCPVRLIHGQRDPDVPWKISMQLARQLRSSDVQTILVKDGDHRLSRDQDIQLLLDVVAKL